jgi:hypothetical protein
VIRLKEATGSFPEDLYVLITKTTARLPEGSWLIEPLLSAAWLAKLTGREAESILHVEQAKRLSPPSEMAKIRKIVDTVHLPFGSEGDVEKSTGGQATSDAE